jgi:hypothetical protein
MTAATDRSQLLGAVADAKRAVEENPRPETYRALLEAQSELQRYDLTHTQQTSARVPEPNAPVEIAGMKKGQGSCCPKPVLGGLSARPAADRRGETPE